MPPCCSGVRRSATSTFRSPYVLLSIAFALLVNDASVYFLVIFCFLSGRDTNCLAKYVMKICQYGISFQSRDAMSFELLSCNQSDSGSEDKILVLVLNGDYHKIRPQAEPSLQDEHSTVSNTKYHLNG